MVFFPGDPYTQNEFQRSKTLLLPHGAPMALTGLDHINLKVRDLERSRRFYELLGLQETGHRAGMLFFSLGDHHHHLALYEVGPDAPKPARGSVGLGHVGFAVESESELSGFRQKLEAAGHSIEATIDHVVSKSMYLRDPDGNMVELAYNLPRSQWANMENPLAEDRPYEVPVKNRP